MWEEGHRIAAETRGVKPPRHSRFRTTAGEGWARSQWEERTPIHVGSDKVHLAVEFSRWRKDGSELSRHKSLYVVTRQQGRWGIQARSSFAA